MSAIEITEQHRTHGGTLYFVSHKSAAVTCQMAFTIFVPDAKGKLPTLYWLSGLTCTANNFTEKSGAYRKAAELGLIVVAPDTSPRGSTLPNDPAGDLGQGAGFYVDATQGPWKNNFQMETYITKDLIETVEANFPADPARRGISGHSMGGHGALTIAMNHAHLFHSVSAFAPIASAMRAPWGEKALTAYIGGDHIAWERYDASLLIAEGKGRAYDTILIDQGQADPFIDNQLMPQLLEQAAAASGQNLVLRYQPGYDHSYYFIQSFIDDHLAFHAERLKAVVAEEAIA